MTESRGTRASQDIVSPDEGFGDGLMIGLDVGSTTVKAVVMNPRTNEILWKDYERHETRQPQKVHEFLERIEADFPLAADSFRIFITGSGAGMLAGHIGAKFVQEVNAVSLAVEHLFPEAGSVIELGGQDAKIIIWQTDPETGMKRKVPSMNDKCAGGTGAVIDKIGAKLQLTGETLAESPYFGIELHPVAGKCGVFAETDINGLQKQGIPSDQLMASLYEAIVQQNLSVLTRGNTLLPTVLLLGGPNTYIPALRDCWKSNIPKVWEERNVPIPDGVDPQDLVVVPDNAQYYAAIGSVLYGKSEDPDIGVYKGLSALHDYIEVGRAQMRENSGDVGLCSSPEELAEFKRLFSTEQFEAERFTPGELVQAFIGIDGGSTSTKGVLMDREGKLLATSYQLSKGNPLADAQDILGGLREQVEEQGATLEVMGVGTTGYAKDMLKESLSADVGIVETVAHTKSALHYYKDVDVIVDVGGQDIKVIILNDGKVKDFKLNTQCSAGNGYFLQSTAARFGYSVSEFADAAFEAERLPVFGYGCAVFMETDIVNFQQLGWQKHEIMAGLAKVLPKNIWLYVVAEPNLAKFGQNFVLQGGTQHNLAAVKAQYDFIKARVPGVNIRVHRFTGESGAIGAALEAIRVVSERESIFIGIEAAENLEFTTTRDESTRCGLCKNDCLRTFIDTTSTDGQRRRYIVATCEKGEVENMEDLKEVQKRLAAVQKDNPNLVQRAAVQAFRSYKPPTVSTIPDDVAVADLEPDEEESAGFNFLPRFRFGRGRGERAPERISQEVLELRRSIKIGMPRVLNMYTLAPMFRTYFEALGVDLRHIVYSDYTNAKMWYRGSRRGSIDQCFPSKAAIAHIHNLIFDQKDHNKPDLIFFPIIRKMPGEIANAVDTAACPTVFITPEVVKAAFTKEGNVFADNGIRYVAPSINMAERNLLTSQMYDCFRDILKITPEENQEAMDLAYEAWRGFVDGMRSKAREVLDDLEEQGRVGVVMLGRPYHNDPGLNHEIMDEIQKKGYPIFSVESLPQDEDILERLFGDDVRAGTITAPMDITDVWKNAYSENSSKKVWAAKYVARHPNLVAVDLSSFKCGHDAPIFDPIEKVIEATGTPYFTFHDIDENKPTGSINIRVETIDYFLQRYQEHLKRKRNAGDEVAGMVDAYREHLRRLNAKAAIEASELAIAGRVGISGNDGNGHDPSHIETGSAPVFARWRQALNEDGVERPVTDLTTNLRQTDPNGSSRDPNRYDEIRARNRAHIPVEEEIANDAMSCAVPTRDHARGAFGGLAGIPGQIGEGAINAKFVLPAHIQQMLGKSKPEDPDPEKAPIQEQEKSPMEIAGD
ncbi:MAG: acyl-CoA dehydratase activase-related protein [Chloroflexi bacterium]|nr:acyl-CoA dehydratase activase-related protein [Chloroflexota bacterium]